MRYAKYINEREIEYAPKNKAGVSNYDQDIEKLAADGYIPVLETPKPEEGNYTLSYVQEGGQIKFVWTLQPPPSVPEKTEPTLQEQVLTKEGEYGLNRATRTALLALADLGATLDSPLLDRAHEIETLAAPLRTEEAGDE